MGTRDTFMLPTHGHTYCLWDNVRFLPGRALKQEVILPKESEGRRGGEGRCEERGRGGGKGRKGGGRRGGEKGGEESSTCPGNCPTLLNPLLFTGDFLPMVTF